MHKRAIEYRPESTTVTDLLNRYKNRELNLSPGFQRQSVWHERDRAKLIDSILRNYPVPAIFLYRREDDGRVIYDVIDGKQRLESIFMFMGAMRGVFELKTQLPGKDTPERVNWQVLRRRKLQTLVTGYRIPTVEVDGEVGDIIDLFVRINSTGKALTTQEKRHARYFNSPFLKQADKLARRYEGYFRQEGILGTAQLSRMKHVELMCELMLSMHQGDVINKKAVLDRVMSSDGFSTNQTARAAAKSQRAINRLRRMFPKLRTTRFCKVVDYYSLVVLIGKFEEEKLILSDRRRNALAWDLLKVFGAKVDEMRQRQRRLKGTTHGEEIYRDYLMTVSQMTDDVSQRRKREAILRGLLVSLFERKDSKRGFSAEQRRIIWNTSVTRKCANPNHRKLLTWDDFTIDHIDPYSKGGRTKLENAALMCRSCNSAKKDK